MANRVRPERSRQEEGLSAVAEFSSWRSYFYPAPHDATLRNRPGIEDATELAIFEQSAVQGRQVQLRNDPSLATGQFDAEHVRAIHAHLFQDLYDWAGQYRSMPIMKGAGEFAAVDQIEPWLEQMQRTVEATDWAQVSHPEFARAAAQVFAQLNYAHPFREGNGRTAKALLDQLSDQSAFKFEFGQVGPELWNQRAEWTRPDLGSNVLHPEEMAEVFEAITFESDSAAVKVREGVERVRPTLRASHPQRPSTDPTARDASDSPPVSDYGIDCGEGMRSSTRE